MLKTRHNFTFNKQNKGQICGITVNEIIDEFRTGNVSLSERTDIPVRKDDIVAILSESYDIEGKNVDFNKSQHIFYQKPSKKTTDTKASWMNCLKKTYIKCRWYLWNVGIQRGLRIS